MGLLDYFRTARSYAATIDELSQEILDLYDEIQGLKDLVEEKENEITVLKGGRPLSGGDPVEQLLIRLGEIETDVRRRMNGGRDEKNEEVFAEYVFELIARMKGQMR